MLVPEVPGPHWEPIPPHAAVVTSLHFCYPAELSMSPHPADVMTWWVIRIKVFRQKALSAASGLWAPKARDLNLR